MNSRHIILVLSALVSATALTACSNRAVYENLQINKRQECSRLPIARFDECMGTMSLSYEEYERQRRSLKDAR